MALSAEWRTGESGDTVVIVEEGSRVRAAHAADTATLTRFLTDMGDLVAWSEGLFVPDTARSPESWGEQVMSRASTGEVLAMEPQLYWDGIYRWYRSRGVDYDSDPHPVRTRQQCV
jgi:hypothetical protein